MPEQVRREGLLECVYAFEADLHKQFVLRMEAHREMRTLRMAEAVSLAEMTKVKAFALVEAEMAKRGDKGAKDAQEDAEEEWGDTSDGGDVSGEDISEAETEGKGNGRRRNRAKSKKAKKAKRKEKNAKKAK